MSNPVPVPEDRLLNMAKASKLLGVKVKRLRITLQGAHTAHGNVLSEINGRYYVTESALKALFPQIFSNNGKPIDERITTLESEVETITTKLAETRKQLYSARVRIRQLEDRLRPGKANRDE